MKKTNKILALVLVLMMVLPMFSIFASAAAPEVLYLTPNANWKSEGARFAAYFFGNGEKWVSMTDADKDGVYEVAVPAGYPNVIFCRMNPNNATNSWNTKYNQTADLTIPTGGANHYTVKEGTWDKGGGTWSTFGSTCAHANLGEAATCTTPQKCLDCGDPVVSELGHTYDSAHLCSRCNEQATFTVAGSGAHLGSEWDPGNKANDMTYADGVYTKVYTNVAAGSYKLKVARDHDWGTAYPSADKAYTVSTAGSTVTVTLKGTTVDIKVEAPHVHNFVEGKCECGEIDPEYVAPHEHNYVADVTAPTCTTAGFTTHTCECGDTYKDSEVPATGHTTMLDICMVCFLPQPSIVLGENTVNVPESGSAFGMIQITEQDTYQITDAAGAIVCIFTTNIYSEGADFSIAADGTLGASWYAFSTTPVELAPGYYYVGVYGAGEHTVTVSKYEAPVVDDNGAHRFDVTTDVTVGDDKGAIAEGTVYGNFFTVVGSVTQRVKEGEVYAIEVAKNATGAIEFTLTQKSTVKVMFSSTGGSNTSLIGIIDADGNLVANNEGITEVTGANDGKTEVTYTLEAGTYRVVSPVETTTEYKRGARVYYIDVAPAAPEVPEEKILVVGDNNMACTESHPVGDLGPYEFIKFTVEEDGHYKFTSDKLAGFTIYTTEINAEGADFAAGTGASWATYTFTEADLKAGTYWVGIIYIGGVGDYTITLEKHEHSFTDGKCECGAEDPNYVPPHEHEFVEGKCECGETDPEYVAPEQPPVDEPTEEPTEPTGFFAQLMAFFQMILAFFKNLFKF